MAESKDEAPAFDYKSNFKTRGGQEVLPVIFVNKSKIMGTIIDKDGEDGVFCSWEITTGKRIGMGTVSGDHIQDLINGSD